MNKFNARRSEYAGHSFASQGERDCYIMLKALYDAGEYSALECQVTTKLTAGITHRTDFRVFDMKLNEPVWKEYKGFEDQRWRMIKKLWRVYGPGRLHVYGGRGLRIKLMEEIIPKGEGL